MPSGTVAALRLLLLGIGSTAGAGAGVWEARRARGSAAVEGCAPRAPLVLRGGFDPLRAVSTPGGADAGVDLSMPVRRWDPVDNSLLEGDVQRVFRGGVLDEQEAEALDEQFSKVADDVILTQQFLVLQNIRIEDQLPGGANCSYAETWYTGALWEKADDELQWTRAAWLQYQRAKTWQDAPPIYKRIMRNAWEDLQVPILILKKP
jgi:hypothetical protein